MLYSYELDLSSPHESPPPPGEPPRHQGKQRPRFTGISASKFRTPPQWPSPSPGLACPPRLPARLPPFPACHGGEARQREMMQIARSDGRRGTSWHDVPQTYRTAGSTRNGVSFGCSPHSDTLTMRCPDRTSTDLALHTSLPTNWTRRSRTAAVGCFPQTFSRGFQQVLVAN